MNIQSQLFRAFNIVKHQAAKYDKKWQEVVIGRARDPEIEINPLDHYYAAYYAGAYDIAKILVKTYQGELTDSELDLLLGDLDNPGNEELAN